MFVVILVSVFSSSLPTKFINSRPGRPHDDLATVIYDHPVFKDMPHDGFCGWQFNKMLDGGTAVCFINDTVPFEPVLEMASSYKYIIRRAAIFEYNIFRGKLLVCGLNFVENDPASNWFKAEIIKYASGDEFEPSITLTDREFEDLLTGRLVTTPIYNSFALNINDKSSTRKKRK